MPRRRFHAGAGAAILLCATATVVLAHGNVTPQKMDSSALPPVEAGLTENPYRGLEGDALEVVLRFGESAYNQNCARCHGLGGVSGGLAPDLRMLRAEEYDDEWFMERYRNGYTQGGITRMPAFGDLLGEEAGWAIRTYAEMRPDDASVEAFSGKLTEIRDTLKSWNGGDLDPVRNELMTIAEQIETHSGAPVADSIALRAAKALNGSPDAPVRAAEILTVGLSAAQ